MLTRFLREQTVLKAANVDSGFWIGVKRRVAPLVDAAVWLVRVAYRPASGVGSQTELHA